jgi:hypothetical protein
MKIYAVTARLRGYQTTVLVQAIDSVDARSQAFRELGDPDVVWVWWELRS